MLAEQWGFPAFRPADRALVTKGTTRDRRVTLIKPQTYMNLSGAALAPSLAVAGFDPSRDLLVLVDDLALPLGSYRLRAHGSAGGHRGLESVEAALESQTYARLRIGIGPLPDDVDDQSEYVLAPFAAAELTQLAELLPDLTDAVTCWVTEGIDVAMNRFNRRGTAE